MQSKKKKQIQILPATAEKIKFLLSKKTVVGSIRLGDYKNVKQKPFRQI